MTSPPRAHVERALADAGWPRVQDRILAGLCHDLNGRVSALEGLVQLIRLDEPDTERVGGYLAREVTRLEGTVRLLRGLPGDPAREREALVPGDVLPELVELHGRYRLAAESEVRLEGVEDAPPVLVGRPRFERTLLTLFAAFGDGSGGRATLCRTVPGPGLTLRVEPAGTAGGPPEAPAGDGPERCPGRLGATAREALERLVGWDGGSLAWGGDGDDRTAELTWPDLRAARDLGL